MFDRQANRLTTAKLGKVIRALVETSDIAYDTVHYSSVFFADKKLAIGRWKSPPASLRLLRLHCGHRHQFGP